MKKLFVILMILVTASLLVGLTSSDDGKVKEKHPDVDFSVSCVECHTEVTPEIVKEWKSSAHGKMNFGCYMCHGDGQQEFYAQPGTQRCISCHPQYEVDFSKTNASKCFDCHQGHTLKFHKIDE